MGSDQPAQPDRREVRSRLGHALPLLISVAWAILLLAATHLLLQSEIQRWSQRFERDSEAIASELRNRLDTHEAILSGLTAFLRSIEQSDIDAAQRYAAAIAAAYPQAYMLEIASRVERHDEHATEAALRQAWRPDFRLKDFAAITQGPSLRTGAASATWPIVFMYPELPGTAEVYGVRLETVPHLARTLAIVHGNPQAVASPIFNLYEGGRAFILLQEVERTTSARKAGPPNVFGNAMVALLLIRTEALMPSERILSGHMQLGFAAHLQLKNQPDTLIFERRTNAGSVWDRILLPRFSRIAQIPSDTQPVELRFQEQLRWRDVLSSQVVALFLILMGALGLVPWLTFSHYRNLKRANLEHERAAYLSTHDLLTSLPNRYLFADRFDQALQLWRRHQTPFAVMLIDVDHFKSVNDQFGHEVGDQVLTVIAQRMEQELRASDTVARHGGDEFMVLLAHTAQIDDAVRVGHKLLEAIRAPIDTTAGPQTLSCSIGVALCPTHGTDLSTLIRRADHAMYAAKQQGRHTVSVSTET